MPALLSPSLYADDLFPCNCLLIVPEEPFPFLEFPRMDYSPAALFPRAYSFMQHLMVHDKSYKISRYRLFIQHRVYPYNASTSAIAAKGTLPHGIPRTL